MVVSVKILKYQLILESLNLMIRIQLNYKPFEYNAMRQCIYLKKVFK